MDIAAEHRVYEFDDFRIDVAHLMLYHRGTEIAMVPKAIETLLALIERRGKIVSKDELLEAVWPDTVVEESNLFLYLSLLRKTLRTHKDGSPYVETLRRRGYRFNGDVHLVEEEIEDKNDQLTVDEFEQTRVNIQSQVSEGTLKQATRFVSDREGSRRSKLRYVPAVSIVILLAGVFAASFYWRSRQVAVTNVAKPNSIAILPFKSIGSENREEALGIGIVDTLTSRLASSRSITVCPPSSVQNVLKSSPGDHDPREMGKKLGVESVLDGTVQRSGDLIRVNVSLTRVDDKTRTWSKLFDARFTEIFNVQDQISAEVLAVLESKASREDTASVNKRHTNNPDAYQQYLLGRFYSLKVTPESLQKAIDNYGRAIAMDPSYSLAYAGMAYVKRTLAIAGFSRPAEVCPQAEELAKKALQLDETQAEPYISLAVVDFLYKWDWKSAESNLKHAIDLEPNNSDAHKLYAHFLSSVGRHEEAIAEGRLASDLSPATSLTRALESQFLLFAGRQDEAMRTIKTTLEVDPNFWVALNQLGRIYIRQQRYEEAIVELEKARKLAPESCEPPMQIGYALAVSGNRERARATLSELERRSKYKFVPFYSLAMIHNGLGERDKALEMLERGVDNRESQLTFILSDNRWDNLRSQPRFRNILHRMNLDN
jgi:DNA-binding winged helix-turn-helix (wHTH) protein/TolB-like protein/tetratricopeptide (TPR) repeat protein